MVAWERLASLDHEGEAAVPIARQGDRLAAGDSQPLANRHIVAELPRRTDGASHAGSAMHHRRVGRV